MLADAVFDVISESPAAKHVKRMVNGSGWCEGTQPVTDWPTLAARPVENAIEPSASPPPKRKIVPQSIRTASAHDMVNRRCRQFDGQDEQDHRPCQRRSRFGHRCSVGFPD